MIYLNNPYLVLDKLSVDDESGKLISFEKIPSWKP